MSTADGEGGPTALVVGGSGDIGRAVALRIGELGYDLVVTGRRQDRVDEAVAGLRSAGHLASGHVLDLSDTDAIEGLFDGLAEGAGGLDVLVNAAGVATPRPLLRADREHFDEALTVNLVGPALVARRALMLMRRARSGTIVHVTSLGGVDGRKGFGAYSAAKGALIALSDSLRKEAARYGVRVASVCPGEVDTQMHGDSPEREKMIRPEDVAEAVAFLLRLSPRAEVREVRIHNPEG